MLRSFTRLASPIRMRQAALYSTSSMSQGEQHIYNKLTEALEPHKLRVVDVSGIIKQRFIKSTTCIDDASIN